MGEKMLWSEAEEVVRAYRTEQALGTAPKRRFIDRSGALSAALTLGVVLAGAILVLGPGLVAQHPVFAAFRPTPAPVERPLAPTPVIARRVLGVPGHTFEIRKLEPDESL